MEPALVPLMIREASFSPSRLRGHLHGSFRGYRRRTAAAQYVHTPAISEWLVKELPGGDKSTDPTYAHPKLMDYPLAKETEGLPELRIYIPLLLVSCQYWCDYKARYVRDG